MSPARTEDALFQHVLGAGSGAVEKAVIDRKTTGERHIATVVMRMSNLFEVSKHDTYVVLGITSSGSGTTSASPN